MKINKLKLNFTIDIIMFMVLMAVAGIGFLIKYVLVPGFTRNELYGKDVALSFNSMDRHQWGSIHLILGFIFLFLLLLHIVFHWRQIVSIFKRMVGNGLWRFVLTTVFVLFSIVFFVVPLFVRPKISHSGSVNKEHIESQIKETELKGQHVTQSTRADLPVGLVSSPNHPYQKHENYSETEIFGYMTIDDVAKKYNISANKLASAIHVPVSCTNEKLGRLRKKYSFRLNDLKKVIEATEIQP